MLVVRFITPDPFILICGPYYCKTVGEARRTDGCMGGWTDGRTDGRMDGRTDGWTDGRKNSPFYRISSSTEAAAQKVAFCKSR